jgi:hypothetical protein
MIKQLVVVSVLGFGFTACGSSGGVAATASEGDAFCTLAQSAKDDNDSLSALDGSDAAKLKVELSGAIDSLTKAVGKAPKDIVDTAKILLAKEVELENVLKKYDYDIAKMTASDEGKKIINDESAQSAGDDFDKYLNDKCGIAPDDTVATDDTIAADDTVVTNDTIDSGGTGTLGDDAINSFLDIYEQGTGTPLSDEERSCLTDALSGKLTNDDLSGVLAGGQPSDAVIQALALGFVNCNVALGS